MTSNLFLVLLHGDAQASFFWKGVVEISAAEEIEILDIVDKTENV